MYEGLLRVNLSCEANHLFQHAQVEAWPQRPGAYKRHNCIEEENATKPAVHPNPAVHPSCRGTMPDKVRELPTSLNQ